MKQNPNMNTSSPLKLQNKTLAIRILEQGLYNDYSNWQNKIQITNTLELWMKTPARILEQELYKDFSNWQNKNPNPNNEYLWIMKKKQPPGSWSRSFTKTTPTDKTKTRI